MKNSQNCFNSPMLPFSHWITMNSFKNTHMHSTNVRKGRFKAFTCISKAEQSNQMHAFVIPKVHRSFIATRANTYNVKGANFYERGIEKHWMLRKRREFFHINSFCGGNCMKYQMLLITRNKSSQCGL